MGNVLGFNSRTPGGVRLLSLCVVLCSLWFQFTHPGRGATISESCFTFADRFQFTHPGRGATTDDACADRQEAVSIHAPREGCDVLSASSPPSTPRFQFTHPGRGATTTYARGTKLQSVSIHAPREGCDLADFRRRIAARKFQFTHPGRGATRAMILACTPCISFNSRTPGGVRLPSHYTQLITAAVSIHAPREGCDLCAYLLHISGECFNSRTPGGVRLYRVEFDEERTVSIHAPREGCDIS